jgi:hypothetical protein
MRASYDKNSQLQQEKAYEVTEQPASQRAHALMALCPAACHLYLPPAAAGAVAAPFVHGCVCQLKK